MDAEHIRVVPASQRIECIDKPISSPSFRITLADRPQHQHAIFLQEGQRTASRAWNDAAVQSPHPRRTTPSLIARRRIGGSDTPKMRAVVGKFIAQRNTKPLMRLSCRYRV